MEKIFEIVEEFGKQTHGSSDYHTDLDYIRGSSSDSYVPLKYLNKKYPSGLTVLKLLQIGFIQNSLDLFGNDGFAVWYEKQFSRKIPRDVISKINLYIIPDNKNIIHAIELVDQGQIILKKEQILLNGKKLPVQIGEWYARCIFGLTQKKSATQRGFDFKLDGKQIEVVVHWSDISSPKGVKIRKSLVKLSEYVIIVYLSRNFMIRELCFFESAFLQRKFTDKGHTFFLKDSDLMDYFFSKSSKYDAKVINKSALLKYSNSSLAIKLAERFS